MGSRGLVVGSISGIISLYAERDAGKYVVIVRP